jgi:phospholipase/carboxylesterase
VPSPHLLVPPRVPSPRPPLLVLLHGIGADEHDLLPLAAHLDPRFAVVSLRAPFEAEPMGYAWYRLDWREVPPRPDLGQAAESRAWLGAMLGELPEAAGADPERLFLFGFSQGAAMATAVLLDQCVPVRGAVLHSGRVPPEVAAPTAEALEGVEVLVLHGTDDPVLPPEHGRALRDLLAPVMGGRLEHREYRAAHEVTAETLADAAAWLSRRLG